MDSDAQNISGIPGVAAGIVPVIQLTSDKKKEVNEWLRLGISLGVKAALHPFDYAKTLIQLGYEPIPPIPGKSLLRKQILLLPNIFKYTTYIRKVDGFWGCYNGLTPRIFGLVAVKLVNRHLINNMGFKRGAILMGEDDAFVSFKDNLRDEVVLCVAGAVISYPFHLISVRMMAQFVGQESLYSNILSSIKEIFRTEGITGFFNGIIPHLLWDVGCLVLTASTVYLVNKYITQDKVKKQFSVGIVQYFYSNILYPFHVTSTCMCVTGSRLAAGNPPIMPVYKNWIHCLADLNRNGELKRGNSFLLRTTNKISYPTVGSIAPPQFSLKAKFN